ncbi:hypothetical protein ABIF66_002940 [Bradyrhizobium japonicum]
MANNTARALVAQLEFSHPACHLALQRGWYLFPVIADAKLAKKIPAFSARQTNGNRWGSSNDPAYLDRLFARLRARNAWIGLATGPDSGIFVVDIDTIKGHGDGRDGHGSLRNLVEKYGPLPSTLTALTPSGGEHFYFNYPRDGRKVVSRANVMPGMDIKGWGGYVVTVPSRGRAWRDPCAPIAEPPAWLLDLVCEVRNAKFAARNGSSRKTRPMPERRRAPPPPPDWLVHAMKCDAGRGVSFDPRDSDDNELKIQYALDAIPKSRSHIGYLEWVKIGGMVFCALGENGFDIWHEWSAGGEPGTYIGEESCRGKWLECCKFTEYSRDGASIFMLADKFDTRRVWRAAYATAHVKQLRADEARCILASGER